MNEAPVSHYDLSTPAPLPREVGKRLHAQKETIAEEMRIALRKLLRIRTEVAVGAPVVMRVRHFADFADGKAWWMSGGSKEDPAGKSVLLGCTPGLVYAAIERTLGGAGTATPPERPPTQIDFEFGMRFLRDVFAALANALQLAPLALAVTPHRPLNEPLLTYIPDREEPFARIVWTVKLLDQEHELVLCIARRLLEAAEPKQEAAKAVAGALSGPVASAPIELLVELARCRIKIDEAAQLKSGDVVLFDQPPGEALDVRIQGRTRLRARLGTHDDRYAIEVTEVLEDIAAGPIAADAKAAKPAAAPAPSPANGAQAAAATPPRAVAPSAQPSARAGT